MSRHLRVNWARVLLEAAIGAAIVVVLFRAGRTPAAYVEHDPVFVEPLEPAPVVPVEVEPDPVRPRVGTAVSRPKPLSFRCAEGVVVVPRGVDGDHDPGVNWMALVRENDTCAWALLSLVANEGAPDPQRHYPTREMTCSAVWRFCPAKWRR
jgi:hypothetical protein